MYWSSNLHFKEPPVPSPCGLGQLSIMGLLHPGDWLKDKRGGCDLTEPGSLLRDYTGVLKEKAPSSSRIRR